MESRRQLPREDALISQKFVHLSPSSQSSRTVSEEADNKGIQFILLEVVSRAIATNSGMYGPVESSIL